jgi:hypothetical protein
MAQAALGHAPYLSGRSAEARPPLEELVARVSAAEQPYAVLTGLAVLSLLAGDEDDDRTALALARPGGGDRRRPRPQRRAAVRDRPHGVRPGPDP